ARVYWLLSDCARRRNERVKARPSIDSGKKDSLSVDQPVRSRRYNYRHSGPGNDVASLQRERPAPRMALLPVRRPRLRRSRRAGISCSCRGIVMAIGGRLHEARARMGLGGLIRICGPEYRVSVSCQYVDYLTATSVTQ